MTIEQLINKAKEILVLDGVTFSYSGESTANGLSVYFKAYYNGLEVKVRFSDHSVTNRDRMKDEVHFDKRRLKSKLYVDSKIAQIGYMLGIEKCRYGKALVEMPNGKIMKGYTYYKSI